MSPTSTDGGAPEARRRTPASRLINVGSFAPLARASRRSTQVRPGATTTLEMPTIPVAAPGTSPGKAGAGAGGRKAGGAAANQSPGLAPGMYNLGGRGSRAKSAEKKK